MAQGENDFNLFADSEIYRIFAASIIDEYEISYRNTELREPDTGWLRVCGQDGADLSVGRHRALLLPQSSAPLRQESAHLHNGCLLQRQARTLQGSRHRETGTEMDPIPHPAS